jgi:hypothetical protein
LIWKSRHVQPSAQVKGVWSMDWLTRRCRFQVKMDGCCVDCCPSVARRSLNTPEPHEENTPYYICSSVAFASLTCAMFFPPWTDEDDVQWFRSGIQKNEWTDGDDVQCFFPWTKEAYLDYYKGI